MAGASSRGTRLRELSLMWLLTLALRGRWHAVAGEVGFRVGLPRFSSSIPRPSFGRGTSFLLCSVSDLPLL